MVTESWGGMKTWWQEQEAEGTGMKQKQIGPSDKLCPIRPYLLNLPNCTTNWGPSVQMLKTIGRIYYLNHHTRWECGRTEGLDYLPKVTCNYLVGKPKAGIAHCPLAVLITIVLTPPLADGFPFLFWICFIYLLRWVPSILSQKQGL